MKPVRRPVTYDDLRRVPEHMVGEIIDGELITSPRPATPHARAAWVLGGDLGDFDGPPGGADIPGGLWFLFEPELHFGTDVIVPDLAGWRRTRAPVIPNAAALTQAPDWVCEVLSPSTARVDRAYKMRIYAREGVAPLVPRSARTPSRDLSPGGRAVGRCRHPRWGRCHSRRALRGRPLRDAAVVARELRSFCRTP